MTASAVPVRVAALPASGYSPARATLVHMQQVVHESHRDPMVRDVAEGIARRASARDVAGQVRALRSYLAGRVQFLRDPTSVEYIKTPRQMIEDIHAHGNTLVDCDDAAVLGAALGTVIGIPARFRALEYAGQFLHVVADVFDGAEWIDLDVTKPAQYLPPVPDGFLFLVV